MSFDILGDPGADHGGKGSLKGKRKWRRRKASRPTMLFFVAMFFCPLDFTCLSRASMKDYFSYLHNLLSLYNDLMRSACLGLSINCLSFCTLFSNDLLHLVPIWFPNLVSQSGFLSLFIFLAMADSSIVVGSTSSFCVEI